MLVAIPSAPGAVMRRIAQHCAEARVRHRVVPSLGELVEGRVMFTQMRDVKVDDLLAREPVRVDLPQGGRDRRSHRPGDRRRRLDRLRAVPAGGRARPGAARAVRPPRERDVPPRGRAARSLPGRGDRAVLGDLLLEDSWRRHSRAPAAARLPRRGLQARAADGGHVAAGGAQQHVRHAATRAGGGATHGGEFVLVSHRQGGEPDQRDGRDQARRRAGGRLLSPPARPCTVPGRALRQRAGLERQRGPAVPGADRARRPGDRHRPGGHQATS